MFLERVLECFPFLLCCVLDVGLSFPALRSEPFESVQKPVLLSRAWEVGGCPQPHSLQPDTVASW